MTKRNVRVDDFSRFTLIGSVSVSPDGQHCIIEQQTASMKTDEYRTELLLTRLSDKTLRPFASSGKRNHSAVWSPDGSSVVFASDREYGTQLWLAPMDGGEPTRMTRFRHGVSSPKFSADGRTIFALVETPQNGDVEIFDPDLTAEEAKKHVKEQREEWEKNPKHYRKMYYKGDGAGLSRLLAPQLVVIDVETQTYRQLTRGEQPVFSVAVAQNGQDVYFVQHRDDELQWWFSDLHRVNVQTGERSLVSNELLFQRIQVSPDGKHLAALAMDDFFYTYKSATNTKLYILDLEGNIERELTASFPDDLTNSNLTDLRAGVTDAKIEWSSDGQYVYTLSTREGKSEVVRFKTDGSTPHGEVVIGGARDVYAFALTGETQAAIAYATPTNPSTLAQVQELCKLSERQDRAPTEPMGKDILQIANRNEEIIYAPNKSLVEELELSTPEPFWYQSQDDWWVQGWLMRPVGFTEGRKYPVILEIHGGPQLNYGYATFHEMQWFASQGYAIVFTNPRGGRSYGQEFVNGVRHHYGDGDAADILAGLDAVLANYDFLDSTRVAVTGGSYGGFMTNWLVGHTNRFFAAVSQRSISNWLSFFGCSDIGPLFVESQLVDKVSGNLDVLWKMSPLAYVEHVETPILLLHSEEDLRCPIEQAEQFYTWLKRQGKEAELYRIPNASHGLSRNGKPSLRVKRLEAIFGFIHERLPQTETTARVAIIAE